MGIMAKAEWQDDPEEHVCKNCKLWCGEHLDAFCPPGFKYCDSPKIQEEGSHPRSLVGDELVYPYDEGGCFYTGPRFGCVHWELK